MEPALVTAAASVGRLLMDAFSGRRKKASINELRAQLQALSSQQVDLKIDAEVSRQRSDFLELVIAHLVTTGVFYVQGDHLRVRPEVPAGAATDVIQGVVEEAEAERHPAYDELTGAEDGRTQSPDPTPRTAAEAYLGGFEAELKERRRRAGL